MTKIIYVDMDSVLVDFDSGKAWIDVEIVREYENRLDELPGIFSLLEPIPDAIESFIKLTKHFDTYIISSSPEKNHAAASEKFQWVKKYLGDFGCKRLILTNHKYLNLGDYLIDNAGISTRSDRSTTESDRFIGEHIYFGSEKFPNWHSVLIYLLRSI